VRVLHVSDGYPPAVGGIEQAVRDVGRGLSEAGHEVAVATLDLPGAPARERDGPVEVHRLVGLTRHLRRFSTDPSHFFHPTVPDPPLAGKLRRLVEDWRPDVIHAHGWMAHSCLAVRRPRGVPLVVNLHEYGLVCARKTLDARGQACAGPSLRRCLPCSAAEYGAAKGTALTLGLASSRPFLGRVDRFVAISGAVRDAVLGARPEIASRMSVIPPFVADDVGEQAAAQPRPDFLPDGPFMLFVGAMSPHKGLDVLLAARRLMADPPPLVVLGIPRSQDIVAGEPGVIVVPRVPHPQVLASWRAAEVGVVPSRWAEPFGLVAVEAMACGTPVVASDTGGLHDIVADGRSGRLVPPGDAEALARALAELLADESLRRQLGEAALERARRFQCAHVMAELLDVYRDARAAAAAGRPAASGAAR